MLCWYQQAAERQTEEKSIILEERKAFNLASWTIPTLSSGQERNCVLFARKMAGVSSTNREELV